jgi:hypothetical protein
MPAAAAAAATVWLMSKKVVSMGLFVPQLQELGIMCLKQFICRSCGCCISSICSCWTPLNVAMRAIHLIAVSIVLVMQSLIEILL